MSSLFNNLDFIPVGIPLSQYTAAITHAVSSSPELMGVWVTAELSDVRSSGGHCYLELIEKNETGQTIAKLRANIWRSTYLQLRQKFYNATQRDITSGIKAMVRGSATHHSIYGLSFNIIDIDPSYTLGDLERLRREIFLKLQKEGLALKNKNLTFPLAPQRIAVISAQGAAGYGDFINHLCGNSEGFVFYPCLFPCVMQGDKVSESIRNALMLIESTAEMWDCVAIVRGGGATTDLNGFDDYELAKAVATCGLPVVVGIGHERDRNILDNIAHTSLKTPTAVAGFFIDQLRTAFDRVIALTDRLRMFSSEVLIGEERRLSTLQGNIPQLALRRIGDAKNKMHSLAGKLPILTENRINKETYKLNSIVTNLGNIKSVIVNKEQYRLVNAVNYLIKLYNIKIDQANQKISNLASLCKVLDPINTLNRGYSVTRINGKAVKTIKAVEIGDVIVTTLPDGEIQSKIIS